MEKKESRSWKGEVRLMETSRSCPGPSSEQWIALGEKGSSNEDSLGPERMGCAIRDLGREDGDLAAEKSTLPTKRRQDDGLERSCP